jgi:signal transduction histidine kinase
VIGDFSAVTVVIPSLEESGLASALNWYVDGLAERSHLAIMLEVADNVGRLPSDMELAIFRVVQECLTNIHRHSGSKTASQHGDDECDRDLSPD